jgi:DNA invertase Pin-like site-specific DNA recombinase
MGHQWHDARHARRCGPRGHDDRRKRQAQGQAKAKAEGKCKGHPADTDRNAGIESSLKAGLSWTTIDSETDAGESFPEA